MAHSKLVTGRDLIGKYGTCQSCGSDVSIYLCNDSLVEVRREAVAEDRWVACDNEECVNRIGSGHFQSAPKWVDRSN